MIARIPWLATMVCFALLGGCSSSGGAAPDAGARPELPRDLGSADERGGLLPVPPADAVEVVPRYPLRNGSSVVEKKRWLWVPPGEAITLSEDGRQVHVPVDTCLWKEFYVRAEDGTPVLVERRLIVKVEPGTGYFGWQFWTSHRTGPAANDNQSGTRYVYSASLADYAMDPQAPLPTQLYDGDTRIQFQHGESYVFPGAAGCTSCHSGAPAAFPGAGGNAPVMSFALHPNNMDAASLERVIAAGFMHRETATALGSPEAQGSDTHRAFVGELRNNCISCHNQAPGAAARHSAFRLDPNHPYSERELRDLLGAAQSRNGPMMYDRRDPDNSELYRAIMGQGRLRMPPVEGGLPDPDAEMLEIIEKWLGI